MVPEASEEVLKVHRSLQDPSSAFWSRLLLTSASLPFWAESWLVLAHPEIRQASSSSLFLPAVSISKACWRAGAGEAHCSQGWACCMVPASHHHPRAQQGNLTALSSVDAHISKTHIQRLPRNVPSPPFWRLGIIPSCLFFLTALSPLLFKLNSYCSKLNPFFLALSLLTNESNSSLCSWWLHSGYLWMRIISFSSLLS